MNSTIRREDLKKIIDEKQQDCWVIEVLPEKYFASGHIPGAINISLDQIHSADATKYIDKHDMVITYCASHDCQNSYKAAEALQSQGFANVREYVGGKADWVAAGYPLEGDKKL